MLSINIICQLHVSYIYSYLLTTVPLSLQPAADVDSVSVCDTLSTSAASTVGQSSCVCVCAITDDYDKGELCFL